MGSEDLKLIQLLKSNDEHAFQVVFEKYASRVYKNALILMKDTGWSDDIVQEVFIKLWKYRDQLLDESNLWNFILVLTRREAYNKLRGIKRSQEAFERLWTHFTTPHYDSEKVIICRDGLDHLQRIIQILPPKQQEVFLLNKIDGLSYEEIANKLGISNSTVRNHLVVASKVIKSRIRKSDLFILLLFCNF